MPDRSLCLTDAIATRRPLLEKEILHWSSEIKNRKVGVCRRTVPKLHQLGDGDDGGGRRQERQRRVTGGRGGRRGDASGGACESGLRESLRRIATRETVFDER